MFWQELDNRSSFWKQFANGAQVWWPTVWHSWWLVRWRSERSAWLIVGEVQSSRVWVLLWHTDHREYLWARYLHQPAPVNSAFHSSRVNKSSTCFNIQEWMGQSMSSLLRVADDRCRWAAITAEASVGYLNDAWASRVLTDWLLQLELWVMRWTSPVGWQVIPCLPCLQLWDWYKMWPTDVQLQLN